MRTTGDRRIQEIKRLLSKHDGNDPQDWLDEEEVDALGAELDKLEGQSQAATTRGTDEGA